MSLPPIRTLAPAVLLLLAACGGGEPASPPDPASESVTVPEPAAHVEAERLVARYGCTSCHAAPADAAARLAPVSAPDLSWVGRRMTLSGLASWAIAPRPGADGHTACGAAADPRTALDLAAWLADDGAAVTTEAVEVLPTELEAGRLLFDTMGCRACHDADGPKGGLDVDAIANERTIASLAGILADPTDTWPAGGHPDLGLDSLGATRLATYLLAADRVELVREPGLRYEYYEAEDFPGAEPDWDAMTPVDVGKADAIGIDQRQRDDQFGLRFTGGVVLPATGTYTFYLASDDGSYLDLGGERVLDHGGLHGPWVNEVELELEAGSTPMQLSMFERTGGEELTLEFQVVGDDGEVLVEQRPFAPEELYFESGMYEAPAVFPAPRLGLDPVAPEALGDLGNGGDMQFVLQGCAGCHAGPGVDRRAPASAASLADLGSTGGCLDPAFLPTVDRTPRLALLADTPAAATERELLSAYLAEDAKPTGPLAPAEHLARELPRLGCLSCHARDGQGGPSATARPWFRQDFDADDLGDEGRIPPSLTGVGAKLQRDWLADVVEHGTHGDMGVRPYMATPMPAFGPDVAARLADAFEAVDAADLVDAAPPWGEPAMEVGRGLVGITGLACITCHDVAGKPSLGIPMIDLANTPDRLRHDWFRRWLLDPVGMRPGTRMSAFYPDGKGLRTDILDGDADAQIDAMWTYLSLGNAMPLPEGLILDPSAYDLEPSGRVIHHACFWEDGSARGVAVGFPERKHYVFDQEHLRVDAMWYGAFVNGAHTWDGRAGGLVVPEGEGLLRFPEGMAVAELEGPDAPWRTEHRRDLGWRYLGQLRDADDVPTWRYAKGEVVVEETLRPIFGPGGHFVRTFRFEGLPVGDGHAPWALRLARGSVTDSGDGAYLYDEPGAVDPGRGVRIVKAPGLAGPLALKVRELAGSGIMTDADDEIALLLNPTPDGTLDVEVEYRW